MPIAGAQRGCAVFYADLQPPAVQFDLVDPIGTVRRTIDQQASCEGNKAGRVLLLARGFLAGRLPSGAFPTSGFARRFALRFRAGSIAFVALAGFCLGLGTFPLIRG